MIKKHLYLKFKLLFAAGILMSFFGATYIYAATMSDLQSKQSKINQEIADKKDELNYKKTEISSIEDEINQIDTNITSSQDKIGSLTNDINTKNNDIANTAEEISSKEIDLNNEYENQKETIRTIYEAFDYSNPIRMILGSSTLAELINYDTYLETLENKIESIIDEIDKLKKDLENKKIQLEEDKKKIENMQEQEKAYKRGLEEQYATKDNLLNNKESEKSSLEDQIAEAKAMESQIEAQISAIIASSRSSSGSVSARDKGVSEVGFMWPADYQCITAYYGESTPFQAFHSGIDLANIPGTPIYASASGTVTTAAAMQSGDGQYYGYGNYIIIGHNARFSSLYGHLMGFAVSAGEEVSQGQVIGYMGTTGWSTGPHLHFEIREYGTTKDPLGYLP